jgi:hypothetical protein
MTTSAAVPWSYESLRSALDQLEIPAVAGHRNTLWVSERLLGIARNHMGTVELFLVGPRLHARTSTVRRHLEHGEWMGADNEVFEANRLVLPPLNHFITIAALIGIELVRSGINSGRGQQAVFEEVEPIIELALRRGALSEEALLGLLGELMVLEQLLVAFVEQPSARSFVLDWWRGHQRGERDFVIGTTALEVKTTSQQSSSHQIQSLHQVELGEGEEELLLLSVGLAPATTGAQTLPAMVDRLLAILGDDSPTESLNALQLRLLRDVAAYGVGGGPGYDHLTMSNWAAYQTEYRLTFTPRLYDLLDPGLELLKRADLDGTVVNLSSVSYIADLPDRVNGYNPAGNWVTVLWKKIPKF